MFDYKNLSVLDVITYCNHGEYDVFDQLGNVITINEDNQDDIYVKRVERIEACGNKVKIFTFDKLDERRNGNRENKHLWTSNNDPKMILLIRAMLDKINNELKRLYWNEHQCEIESPFGNNGTSFPTDYFVVRSYYWGDDEKICELPNFETSFLKVWWYKHSNRDVQYAFKYGFESYDTIASELEKCIESLNRRFGGED